MTCAVIRQWVIPLPRRKQKSLRDQISEMKLLERRAFMPKAVVDLWFAGYFCEEDDIMGQWADDGGR